MQELRRIVPDMELIEAPQLPQVAVLIAESYRVKLEVIVADNVRTTPNPHAYLEFLPGGDGPISGQEITGTMSATLRRSAAMV